MVQKEERAIVYKLSFGVSSGNIKLDNRYLLIFHGLCHDPCDESVPFLTLDIFNFVIFVVVAGEVFVIV